MFRIRRIHDDVLPVNRDAIRQVQEILRQHFTAVHPEEIEGLAEKLRNPFKQRFRSVLLVAERQRGGVVGFGFLMHEPELQFCYLDFIASAKEMTGRGIGGALYHRVRQEARALGVRGLFFECLPDDPAECDDAELLAENVARLRFYERFGVRPIVGTAYESPIRPGDRGLPYLMFDGLDPETPLPRDFARHVVRAILERKYGHLCPPEYVQRVVESYSDDPIRIRPPRYSRNLRPPAPAGVATIESIALVINEKHDIHHVRERGYVQSPVRIKSILAELEPAGWFQTISPRKYPQRFIKAVHDGDFVEYLRKACAGVPQGKSVYPYVFPLRNAARPPKELSVRAGYYCIDTFTPLNMNAYLAAKRAVDCTLTAADEILRGRRMAYALVRPPGHHAERRAFGGFCYFNNAAVAAEYFSRYGKVAIVDLDYHHGNGQENIFYKRNDVLTVSIHGHPNFAYPYFSGFADERGEEAGEGFNWNLPLAEVIDGAQYREALAKALGRVAEFDAAFLIVALGLDTAKGDPTGTWLLTAGDFESNGRMVSELDKPTLVVQEGGYRTRTLGVNARRFFAGLLEGAGGR
jgi:acetoin utilization deacetylase AcuC-like enzyme/GNAT superfamily N-acetyltransferase